MPPVLDVCLADDGRRLVNPLRKVDFDELDEVRVSAVCSAFLNDTLSSGSDRPGRLSPSGRALVYSGYVIFENDDMVTSLDVIRRPVTKLRAEPQSVRVAPLVAVELGKEVEGFVSATKIEQPLLDVLHLHHDICDA